MTRLTPAALALALLPLPAFAEGCPEGQRLFEHAVLEGSAQCIPADPRRIAFVHTEIIPAFLLGTESVVSNVYFGYLLDAYPGAASAEWRAVTPDIGYLPEADLEVIAAAAPDLIVSADYHPEANERLALIAPTLVVDYDDPARTWREPNDLLARLLGAEEELARQEAALAARIADLRGRLGDEAPTFSIVQGGEPGVLYVYTAQNFGAQILIDAGFRMGAGILSPEEAAPLGHSAYYTLSPERIGDLDADWIVVLPGYDAAAEADLHASTPWRSLSAVREGRLIRPTTPQGQHWSRENTAFAHLVLDDVYRDALGLDPAAVSPNPFAHWLAPAE